jgi:DNA processing protein
MMVATTLSRDEELHWLALQLVPGLGPRKARLLLERLRSPRAIFRASKSELEASGIAGAVAQSILSGCTFDDAVSQHQKMLDTGTSLIPLVDPRYPEPLRQIFDPPAMLFARGRLELLETLKLGVVGTRRPTPYGVAAAERLSADLAQTGLAIVSGMARGIDTAAHRGAISVNGNTIAVLGCGVDVVYPAENRKLAADLAQRGLLLSEFPMSTPAYPQNFPIRNRIVSGLSVGVLVVEGAQYSGSAITARLAMDQGREVFAVPGNITSKMSWGPNLLIKQGAKLVQDAEDVLTELAPEYRRQLSASKEQDSPQQSLPLDQVGQIGRDLMAAVRPDAALHIDELLANLPQYSSSELIAALFELELAGLLKQLPGRNFIKVW